MTISNPRAAGQELLESDMLQPIAQKKKSPDDGRPDSFSLNHSRVSNRVEPVGYRFKSQIDVVDVFGGGAWILFLTI